MDLPRVGHQTGGKHHYFLLFSSFRFLSLYWERGEGGIQGEGSGRGSREEYLKRTDGLSPTTAERINHVSEREEPSSKAAWRLIGDYEIARRCPSWQCLTWLVFLV